VRRAVTLGAAHARRARAAQVAAGNRRVRHVALRVWAGLLGSVVLRRARWVWRARASSRCSRSRTVLSLLGVLLLRARPRLAGARGTPGGSASTRDADDGAPLGRGGSWSPACSRRPCRCSAPGAGCGAAGDLIGSVFGSGRASAAAHGRYNVLLLAATPAPNRIGLRPDSVTLASIDGRHRPHRAAQPAAQPRERAVPARDAGREGQPDGWSCGDECLLNAIYQ
jgi:hypothetical protein